ncbi:MAG: ZIP family metal transporter [Patescibacteria group bacterium]
MLLQILLATALGGIVSLIGGVILLWREAFAKKFSLTLVSFAAGSLIGAAFLELLAESVAGISYRAAATAVIAGILLTFLFEKLLMWYHCHDRETCDYHSFSGAVLFGDAFHNFIDGVIIALSFSVSAEVGIAATVAVFLHEIPQEIGDFGVLLHAGYGKRKVLLYNFLTALTALAGAVAGYLLLEWIGAYVPFLLAFAAGTFIYIAVSDLLPELRHKTSGADIGHIVSIVLGVLVIWGLGVWVPE